MMHAFGDGTPVLLAALVLCLMTACAGSPEQQWQGPVQVESLLTVEEFRAAGLDALDDGELEALNQALTRVFSDGATAGVDERTLAAWERSEEDMFATFGLEDEHPMARQHDSMSSRLADAVTNWSRGREFSLSNDQVWMVVQSPHSGFRKADAGTPVVIRRGAMGSFLMRVDDRNYAVRVRRVD